MSDKNEKLITPVSDVAAGFDFAVHVLLHLLLLLVPLASKCSTSQYITTLMNTTRTVVLKKKVSNIQPCEDRKRGTDS